MGTFRFVFLFFLQGFCGHSLFSDFFLEDIMQQMGLMPAGMEEDGEINEVMDAGDELIEQVYSSSFILSL